MCVSQKINEFNKKVRHVWCHPANRGHQLATFFKIITWQLLKRIVTRPIGFSIFDRKMKIYCYPDGEAASVAVYYNGSKDFYFDYHEMGFMKRYLCQGDNFLDVGANIGAYTLFAASVIGKSGHIDAFEAHPKVMERFVNNIVLNNLQDAVTAYKAAVGEQPGTIYFTNDLGGENHVVGDGKNGVPCLEVPCVRIDDALRVSQYSMGKIDIEGYELNALKGAISMINSANPPVWQIEINKSLYRYGFTEEQLCDWLSEKGFELAIYDVFKHELIFMPDPWKQRQNILAIARNSLPQVLERLGQDLKLVNPPLTVVSYD